MFVLVATEESCGKRPSDVMECVPGELVYLVEACRLSQRDPYGPCDCGITFRGVTSDGVTTTAVARRVDGLDLAAYIDCLDAAHEEARENGCSCDFNAVLMASTLAEISADLGEGVIVERCVDQIIVRAIARQ